MGVFLNMPISAVFGDILKITLRGQWNGEVVTNNVFHYRVSVVDGVTAENSYLRNHARGLWYFLNSYLLAISSDKQNYKSVTAEALDLLDFSVIDGEDFVIPEGDGYGLIGGEVLPPFVTYTFKLSRPSTAFRHGWKRFAGVPESTTNTGRYVGDTDDTDAVADILTSTLVPHDAGNSLTSLARMYPIVYKHTDGGELVEPVEYAGIVSAAFNGIGSQNSRKLGRGI